MTKKTNRELMEQLMEQMIENGHKPVMTGDAVAELKAYGIDPREHGFAAMVERVPDKPPEDKTIGAILCCIEYEEGKPLAMPDNKTQPCDWKCGRIIQFRPYHPDWIQKVCLHCTAEVPKNHHS